MPTRTTPAIMRDVATGRSMKIREGLTAGRLRLLEVALLEVTLLEIAFFKSPFLKLPYGSPARSYPPLAPAPCSPVLRISDLCAVLQYVGAVDGNLIATSSPLRIAVWV